MTADDFRLIRRDGALGDVACCACPCHVAIGSSGPAPELIDVVSAATACASCQPLHGPALTADHDREAARRAAAERDAALTSVRGILPLPFRPVDDVPDHDAGEGAE